MNWVPFTGCCLRQTWLQVICTLAPNTKVLHLRVNAPNPGSWQALSQLLCLEDLQIIGPGGYDDWVHQSRSYSAWRLDDSFCSALQGLTSLRSLALDCAYEADFARLAALTQLRHLSFLTWTNASSEGLVQLSSLTHLTSLQFWGWMKKSKKDTSSMVQRRQAVQAQLGSALLSLQQLQQLELCHAPSGPVTDALAKLTALTQLSLFSGGSDGDDADEHHTWGSCLQCKSSFATCPCPGSGSPACMLLSSGGWVGQCSSDNWVEDCLTV
jgi:hypothetical protein